MFIQLSKKLKPCSYLLKQMIRVMFIQLSKTIKALFTSIETYE